MGSVDDEIPSLPGSSEEEARLERQRRDDLLIASLSTDIPSHILTENAESHLNVAATLIQTLVRGFLARRRCADLRYTKYIKTQEEQQKEMDLQLTRCELQQKSLEMRQQLEIEAFYKTNAGRLEESSAVIIQRTWRAHQRDSKSKSVSGDVTPIDDANLMTSFSPFRDRYNTKPVTYPGSFLSPLRTRLYHEVPDDAQSFISDYSELAGPVQDAFLTSGAQVISKQDLEEGNTQLTEACDLRYPDETEEEFQQRVRKHNLLSLAVEFAQMKKTNGEVLPFGLHEWTSGDVMSCGSQSDDDDDTEPIAMDCGNSDLDLDTDETDVSGQEGEFSLVPIPIGQSQQLDEEDEEERRNQALYCSDRQRVLDSLSAPNKNSTTYSLDPPSFPNNEYTNPSNHEPPREPVYEMEMCFRNEAALSDHESGMDSETEEKTWKLVKAKPGVRATVKTQEQKPVDTHKLTTMLPKSNAVDLLAKQARMQTEARIALAQAEPMAKMQLEIERQSNRSLTTYEKMGLGKAGLKLNENTLSSLGISRLQVIVNDLLSRIELLNEELVQQLISRDDLHLEQGSKLIDVEDLTRRAQEIASRLRHDQNQRAYPDNNGSTVTKASLTTRRPMFNATKANFLTRPRQATAKIASFFTKKS